MYRAIDAALVRAAALPATEGIEWPDLVGDTSEHVEQWRAWLQQVWAIDDFATAVEAASPVLAAGVDAILRDPRPARDVRRAVTSVVRYLTRASGRATPFGLFAGVAPARFERSTSVRWGQSHKAVARVDSEWLDVVMTQLEEVPELRFRLRVVANSAATVRGARLVLSCRRQRGAASAPLGEVSVRNTPAVQLIMRIAATPIGYREAAEKVAAEFNASVADVDPLLAGLIQQGLLVTEVRPPTTATDPLGHVVETMRAVKADAVAAVAERVAQLRALHRDVRAHNASDSPPQARERRARVVRAMTEVAPSDPLGVDLRLDCDVALPQAVAREAAAAATVLTRLAPYPFGAPRWQHYHGRFIERYGPHAVVPVRELVADSGLGYPAGYRDSPRPAPPESPSTERDATLMTWAQQAAWHRRTEIVLDEAMLTELEVANGVDVTVQPHTELGVRVQARSRAALDRGEFALVVTGVSRAAGTTTGRFLDLLDIEDQRRMIAAYAELPTVYDTAVPAQVSAPAPYPRTNNVTRAPQVLPAVVALGEHHQPPGAVSLDDLAVTADADRMMLISWSRGCPVEPRIFSAVEMVHHAHPLVRFLIEVNTGRSAACAPFSWGQASRLPFLPRLRYGRTILSPARWRMERTDLPGAAAAWPVWCDRFERWRQDLGVPDTVYVGDSDRRMRLDLHAPAHLSLLRTELDRAGSVALREAPPDEEFGWCDGHAHEVVIPLAATTSTPAPRWSPHPIDREHGHLPGREWAYVKVYGHPARQDTILTEHLPELLTSWEDGVPEWWFLRYVDPDPHLRLRVRLSDRQGDDTIARITGWIARLRERGLVGRAQLDTYYPEQGRFGPGAAMHAAETVFAADSAAVLAQLRTIEHRGVPALALTAASMVNLVCSMHTTPAEGMRWLIKHARTPSGPAAARAVRDEALRLADPSGDWAAMRSVSGGEEITAAWRQRGAALLAYREALESIGRHDPPAVLADLLHLHHVRMAGIDLDGERACLRLARAAALSWTARTP